VCWELLAGVHCSNGCRHVLESNNVVTRLHICDALTNGLNDTSTLVPEDDGEGTLGVLARQCVGICVADTGVVDLNADLVGLGGCDLDILNGEILAGFPGNGGLFWSVQLLGPFVISFLRSPRLSAAQCLSTRADPQAPSLEWRHNAGQRSSGSNHVAKLKDTKLQNVPCR
jgi:hypothetical protein